MSGLDFDGEKKYTAYFAANDSHNNDDSQLGMHFLTNLSRKSTMGKKPNINILF
jgi:hypothetical protein